MNPENTKSTETNITTTPIGVNQYEPVDILELGYDPNYIQTVDEEFLDMTTTIAPYINGYTSGRAGISPEPKPQSFEDTWFDVQQTFPEVTKTIQPQQRQAFSIRDTNFDRYYNHPKFSELGFNPYRDNETYYNENSTWYDNFSRAMGQYGANFWPAFSFFGLSDVVGDTNNQGIFDVFSGDPDVESAVKMEEAMRIGNDSREGFGAAFNRFALNSAYSVGIMSSIAAEEVAMWGGTALLAASTPFTGGATGPAAVAAATASAARTGYNMQKLTRAFARMGDAFAVGRAFKAGRSMVQGLRNVDNARDFWTSMNTGEAMLGRIFLPETMQALRTFERTKDVGNSIAKLGKASAFFGGFYRDIRMIDLALDESRLEAGFVYNNMISNGIHAKRVQTDRNDLTQGELKEIQEQALNASMKTTLANAPMIYLTNRVSIGSVVSPFSRGLRRVLDDGTGKLGKRLIQTKKNVVDGKVTTGGIEAKKSFWSREGLKQRKNAYSFGDYVRKGAHGAVRFFAANIAEGVQELYQEALQVGVVDYHTELLKDPAADKRILFNAALDDAIDSQYSAQGLEVFMSGFATGGILGGGSKFIYNIVPSTYNRIFNKEEFQAQRQRREDTIQRLVKIANKFKDQNINAELFQDDVLLNFVRIRQGAAEQEKDAYDNNASGFEDNQDFVSFNELEFYVSHGGMDILRKQYRDFLKMTDTELNEAFAQVQNFSEKTAQDIRSKIEAQIDRSYSVEEDYNEFKDQYPNPFNPGIYPPDDPRHQQELINYRSWEHMRYLMMFTKNAFRDGVRRMQNITEELTSSDIVYMPNESGGKQDVLNISKLGASDMVILLDKDSIRREISLLDSEIAATEVTDETKEIIESKKKRRKLLSNYYDALTDPSKQTKPQRKDGLVRYDRRNLAYLPGKQKGNALEDAFIEYVEFLASENKAFANRGKVKEVLRKILDYGELQIRTKMYDKAVTFLANPELFNDVFERSVALNQNIFNESWQNIEVHMRAAIDRESAIQLLNDLHEIGVIPDPDQAEEFLKSGDASVLTDFYNEYGSVDPLRNPNLILTIELIKENYTKASQTTEEAEETTEDEEFEDDSSEDSTENLYDKSTSQILSTKEGYPTTKDIIKRLHIIYNTTASKRLSLAEFSKTKDASKVVQIMQQLKDMWMQQLPNSENIQDIVRNEEGFVDWILSNKDNPFVDEMVSRKGADVGLTYDIIAGKIRREAKESSGKGGKKGGTTTSIPFEQNGIRVRAVDVQIEGETRTGYIVEYSDGRPITDEDYKRAGVDSSLIRNTYLKLKDAKDMVKALSRNVVDTDTFEFGGLKDLYYGLIIVDKKGKKFVVLGTPSQVKPNGTLYLMPVEEFDKYDNKRDRQRNADKSYTVKKFKAAKFKILEESFEDPSVSDGSPRLTKKNILGLYLMGNEERIGSGEAEEILRIIYSKLQDPSVLQIEIDKNALTDKDRDYRKSLTDPKSKKTNDLVKWKNETHSFRVEIKDKAVRKDINDALFKATGKTLSSFTIQLPSGNVALYAAGNTAVGEEINPFSLTNDDLALYFKDPKKARLIMATQGLIRKRLLSEFEKGVTSVPFADVAEILRIGLSYYNIYDTKGARPLEEFEYNDYEGEKVVIDFSYLYQEGKERTAAPNVITDYRPGSAEHKELEAKVLEELRTTSTSGYKITGLDDGKKSLYDYLANDRATDRYHAVIKTPQGNIILAPLKAEELNEEQKQEFINDVVARATETINSNVEIDGGKVTVKNMGYNDEWNTDFNSKFYISLNKSGFRASVKLTAFGDLTVSVIDFNNRERKDISADLAIPRDDVRNLASFSEFLMKITQVVAKSKDLKAAGIKIQGNSFRTTLPKITSSTDLYDKTLTNLKTDIFNGFFLQYDVDYNEASSYAQSQEALRSHAASTKTGPEESRQQKKETAIRQTITSGLEDLSDEDFEALEDERFEDLDNEMIEAIAKVFAVNPGGLSERDRKVFEYRGSDIISSSESFKATAKPDEEDTKAAETNSGTGIQNSDNSDLTNAQELEEAKQDLEAYTQELLQRINDGTLTKGDFLRIKKGYKKDDKWRELNDRIRDLENPDGLAPFKILQPEELGIEDVEAIDDFIAWARESLPEFVQIRDIQSIADRLKVNGIPVGLFAMQLKKLGDGLDIEGNIYVGDKGFRYHEAFHAVFRLLLTDEEQAKFLRLAKKEVLKKLKAEGTTLRKELDLFRSKAERYASLTDSQLEKEYLEEYMADQFELFKANPSSTKIDSSIKSWFTSLIEWIKKVIARFMQSDLERLYDNISAGRYRNATIQDNFFTREARGGVTTEAFKIFAYNKKDIGFETPIYNYLDGQTATLLMGTMAGSYLRRFNDGAFMHQNVSEEDEYIPSDSRADIIRNVIQDFRELYDPLAEHNADKSDEEFLRLDDLYTALGGNIAEEDEEAVAQAKEFEDIAFESLVKYLTLFDDQIANRDEIDKEIEYEYGLRGVGDWDSDQSMIGGFGNLSIALRAFIGTTRVSGVDAFGNEKLLNGERILIPVDFQSAYNGLLKAVKNLNDPIAILQSMVNFGKANPETGAVVDRILDRLGVDEETVIEGSEDDIYNRIQEAGSTDFLNDFYNSLENVRLDYLFVHKNTETTSLVKHVIYSPANRDDATNQVDVWKQAFNRIYKQLKTDPNALNSAAKSLETLQPFLITETTAGDSVFKNDETFDKITNKKLNRISKEMSDDIAENLGIRFSPAYIAFTIAKNIDQSNRTKYQQTLVASNTEAEQIYSEDISAMVTQISQLAERQKQSSYLFSKKGGIQARLKRLAKNNALFDETIGQSVFLNPEGKMVYAHQLPTLNTKSMLALNDVENLENIKSEDEGFNEDNMLLLDPTFLEMSKQRMHGVVRAAGIKAGKLGATSQVVLDENAGVVLDKNGTTYGNMTQPEFYAMLINLYLANYGTLSKTNKTVELPDGTKVALAPVLIRVLEASNTGDFGQLPIHKTVTLDSAGQVKLRPETIDYFINEINREFKRIQREAAKPDSERVPKEGYNAKNGVLTENKGRAFQFADTGSLLQSVTQGESRVIANDPQFKSKNEKTAQRILEGEQKTFYVTEVEANYIGLVNKGTSGTVEIKSGKEKKTFVIRALGAVDVTPENKLSIISSLGGAVVPSQQKVDSHQQRLKIGDQTYNFETKVMRDWVDGKGKARYGYEVIEVEDFEEMEQESLYFDFKEELEQIAINNPELSLEDAVTELTGDITFEKFKTAVESRLMADFQRWLSELQDLNVINEISTDIRLGLSNDKGTQNMSDQKMGLAMDQLNLRYNKVDHNLAQIFFNDWMNTKSLNQLLHGDQATSLKDGIDKVKRAKGNNASYRNIYTPVVDPQKGILHSTEKLARVVFTEPERPSTYKADGKPVEIADGQMYVTAKGMRHILYGLSQLTDDKALLLDQIEKGIPVDPKYFFEIGSGLPGKGSFLKENAIFNSMKLVYADGKVYDKMSVVLLSPELTRTKNGTVKKQYEALDNMRQRLEKIEQEQEGYIAFASPASASKQEKTNVVPYQDMIKTFDPDEQIVPFTTLDAKYMGLQLVNPSNKVIITDPTQLKSLITSDLKDDEQVYIKTLTGEEKLSVGDIRRKYNIATSNRNNLNYFNTVNLVANFSVPEAMRQLTKSKKLGYLTMELTEFLKFAQAGMKASQAPSNIIDFFDPKKNYNLNNPMVIDKFEQLFLSFFSQNSLSEKIPGVSLALMSDFGVRVIRKVYSVDENGVPDKFEIIRDKAYNNDDKIMGVVVSSAPRVQIEVDDQDRLVGIEEALERSKGKGVIVSDILRHNLKEYNASGEFTGVRYTESLMPAHFQEVAELIENDPTKPIPDVIAKMFSIRIPSQDKHSALATRVVDFLPVTYGSTAIFAKELIEISGADFDIDKVYTHIKEWFVDQSGEFVEYGDPTRTSRQQFEDYLYYVDKKMKSRSSIYTQARNKGARNLEKHQQYTSKELEAFMLELDVIDETSRYRKAGGKRKTQKRMAENHLKALKVLGLPTTIEEFIEFRDKSGYPYPAALSNQILDYKFAMWGNEGNTIAREKGRNPTAYDPAVLTPLTDLVDFIKEELPELAAKSIEEGIDVDNMFGKGTAFGNNKEGAASIGNVVLPNTYLNLLAEYNITIRSESDTGTGETIPQIELNGLTFSNFNQEYERIVTSEKDKNGKPIEIKGDRTQYIVSALITAMTDNAKERLAKRLGINKDALGSLATITKLGVPVKTGVMLINHPVIRSIYYQAQNKKTPFDPGVEKLISQTISAINKKFSEKDPSFPDKRVQVTDAVLMEHIRRDEKMPELYENEADAIELVSILYQFRNIHRTKNYLRNMNAVMNLSKGFGKSIQITETYSRNLKELGYGLEDEQFKALRTKEGYIPPVDVRPIFKSEAWQANNVKILNHFKDVILPNAFLNQTNYFNRILNAVINTSTTSTYIMDEDRRDKISKDLLSFLTIKAYMHSLERKSGSSSLSREILGSLDNSILYPQAYDEERMSIYKIIDDLRNLKRDGKFIYEDNFFLNEFINNESAFDLENPSGMHRAESNTFGKRSESDQMDIQAGFLQLLSENKVEAMHILHYIMVRDGLQFGSGSLLGAVTPIILEGYSKTIDQVFDVMRRSDADGVMNRFGVSFQDLLNEFVLGYMNSNVNNPMLFKLDSNRKRSNLAFYSRAYDHSTYVGAKDMQAQMKENPNRIYIYRDNSLKLGKDGPREMRDAPNTMPLTLLSEPNEYFTDDDLTEFIERLDAEIDAILATDLPIVLPEKLFSKKEIEVFQKKGPEIFTYARKRLASAFGYSLTGIRTESGSYKNRASFLQQPLKVDLKSTPTLTIDMLAGASPTAIGVQGQTYDKMHNFRSGVVDREEGFKKRRKSVSPFEKLKGNIKALRSSGLDGERMIQVTERSSSGKSVPTNVMLLPVKIKTVTGKGDSIQYLTWQLKNVFSPILTDRDTLLDEDGYVWGNGAIYELAPGKGSNFQNGIGFLFDTLDFTRPDYTEVREFIDNMKPDLGDVDFNLVIGEDRSKLIGAKMYRYPIQHREGAFRVNLNRDDKASPPQWKTLDEFSLEELKPAPGQEFSSESTTDSAEETDDQTSVEDLGEDNPEDSAFIALPTAVLESMYPGVVEFWNEISSNPENLEKLKTAEGVASLDDLLNKRMDPDLNYQSDKDFIDQMKCIL